MEQEWRLYLKENAPELYDEMRKSLEHDLGWRDKHIMELKKKLNALISAAMWLKNFLGICSKIECNDKCIYGTPCIVKSFWDTLDQVNEKKEIMMIPLQGKYTHKKGGIYYLIGECKHTETQEELVVYCSEKYDIWARPLPMWLDGRFKKEKEDQDGQ